VNDGPIRYLEIYVEPHLDVNDLGTNGVEFKDSKLRIIPCKAIDDNWNITNVKLSHLPMLPRSEVLEGLKVSLSPFGQVIDVGIITEPNIGFFMGSSYA
ncbi:uncharacterized protein B0P05DRAFT_451237, partial [Gilbertella persicaria]|uniref:uncharacterized protein n=1 Tax=Gilbertella persicaria TaxID=101096 RepID=UPI00221FE1F3